mmetsp:Transcript_102521/g.208717  ORF Transcript_102521/g.208717 Transcript_102521/m.208717 type:complete len:258 (+) Transcript_102521:3263-4036(+)
MCKSESTTRSESSPRSFEYSAVSSAIVWPWWVMTTSSASREVCRRDLDDIFKKPAMTSIDFVMIPSPKSRCGLEEDTALRVLIAGMRVVSFFNRSSKSEVRRCVCSLVRYCLVVSLLPPASSLSRLAVAIRAHSLISWSTSCAARSGSTLPKSVFATATVSSLSDASVATKKPGTAASARRASAMTLYHCSLTETHSWGRRADDRAFRTKTGSWVSDVSTATTRLRASNRSALAVVVVLFWPLPSSPPVFPSRAWTC